jgi:MFS family permease
MHDSNKNKVTNPKELLKDSSLDAAVKDGISHAIMIGSGESYLNAYAVLLQASSKQIGILAGLPPLVGAFFQLVGVWVMEKISSRRFLVVLSSVFQALTWIPIALVPYIYGINQNTVFALITLVTIYNVLGTSVAPIWNSLIGDLVPVSKRGLYFGFRNQRMGIVTCLSLILAGEFLHLCELYWKPVYGFTIIFLFAMLAKLRSAFWLTKYADPQYKISDEHRFSFLQFIRRAPYSNFAKFVLFISFINFSTYIAAPYFSVYMLKDLNMSYLSYTIIIAIGTLAQFFPMQYWGTLSDQFGNRKILTTCGVGASLAPLLWLVSSNFLYLFCVQIYAGFVWAGFNLAAANFIFDAVSPPKRARCIAYQSVVNSAFVLAGSLLGGYLIEVIPTNFPLNEGLFTENSSYFRIFILSGLLRLLGVIFLLPLFKEVRSVDEISHRELIFRVTSLRPLSGISFGIVTGGLRKLSHRKKRNNK